MTYRMTDRFIMNITSKAFILGFLALLLASCSNDASQSYSARNHRERVVVRMKEYSAPFRNTMKGFREFFDAGPISKQRANDFPYPYGSMIKEYMQWSKMEDHVSDGVDKVVAYSNHRWKGYEAMNLKVIPRAYLVWIEPWHGGKPADPAMPDDLNGWHWASDMPHERSPYKNIPGEWGEHHDPDISTFWPPHDEQKHVKDRTWIQGIDVVLGDAFSKAFHNKKVMVRYAYDFPEYPFGIYWDSWAIDEEYERCYVQMRGLGERWKTQPIGGEITWGWGSLSRKGLRSFKDCIMDEETHSLMMEQIRNLHCNHLGGITWTDFSDQEVLNHVCDLQKALGYRYVLKMAEYDAVIHSGKPWKVDFSLVNTGSSPFYYEWPVEVALLDKGSHKKVWGSFFKSTDIREWLPGDDWDSEKNQYRKPAKLIRIQDSFEVANIPEGEYVVALAIVDPAGNLPSVRFANDNYCNGGYTVLGHVGYGTKVSNPELDRSRFDDINSDHSLYYLCHHEN